MSGSVSSGKLFLFDNFSNHITNTTNGHLPYPHNWYTRNKKYRILYGSGEGDFFAFKLENDKLVTFTPDGYKKYRSPSNRNSDFYIQEDYPDVLTSKTVFTIRDPRASWFIDDEHYAPLIKDPKKNT